MDNRPIGVFDSGIGGLTVTKAIIHTLPQESIIYLGDTARVPYGTRSKEVVIQFAKELTDFLLKRDIKALVVACNTVSSLALEEIIKLSPVPVIGVVKPAAKKAVATARDKKIGIIGTPGTIGSRSYEIEIQAIDPSIEVISTSCPLFVPLAEEGLSAHESTKLIAKDYLQDIMKSGIDTLILGCTHYPILQEIIQETVGQGVTLIDSAKPTAEELKKLLEENNLLSDSRDPSLEFYVTDAPERVKKIAGRFFGKKLGDNLKKISL